MLPALPAQKSLVLDTKSDGAQAIGIARAVAAADSAGALTAVQWLLQGVEGASITLRSQDAAAVRVALALHRAPQGAQVRFSGGSRGAGVVLPAAEVVAATRQWGAFWGPVIEGEQQTIEFVAAAGSSAVGVEATIEAVSHLLENPAGAPGAGVHKASAGSCHSDVACGYTSDELLHAIRSTAKLVYTEDGVTYSCSGTLVKQRGAESRNPYILTAKHCIDSPAAAATLNTFWNFEAASCGSTTTREPVQLVRGARLAYAGTISDVALLLLNEPAPAAARFSAIDAAPLAAGETAITVHHPRGAMKKLSNGIVMNPADGMAGQLVAMAWSFGTTEPGSSGAGLFARTEGEYRLRGTLRGGSASCSNSGRPEDPANRDYYSRLDADYVRIESLLRSPAAPLADYTDMWVAPSEPGTGITLTQHASHNIFAVWFVHDETGKPVWLTVPGGTWTSVNSFTGVLYRTMRAAGAVASMPAGTATFTFGSATQGTVQFTVDGVARIVAIERLAF
jgi:hypothetical protein